MIKLFNIEALAPILLIAAIFWIYPAADLSDPRFSAYFRFGACVFIFYSIVLWRVNRAVAVFFILCGISSIYPFSTKHSQSALLVIIIGAGWFYFVSQYGNPKLVMDAIAIIGIGNSMMVLSQWIGFDPIFKPKVGTIHPIVGFLSNPNEVSAMLAFCLPAFFRDKWKKFIPLIFAGLYAAHSTGGVISAVVSIGAYFLIKDGSDAMSRNENYLKLVLLIIGAIAFLHFRDTDISGAFNNRYFVWGKAVKMMIAHPFTGIGIGHWKVVWKAMPVNGEWWMHAHNEYLQTAFETGIGFIAAAVLYFVGLIRSYDKSKLLPATAIVCIAINSIVNFPFHIAQTAAVAIAWMGIYQVNNVTDCATFQRTSTDECPRLHSNGRKPGKKKPRRF